MIVTLSLDGRAENLSMLQGLKDRKIFSEDSVLQGILDASLGRLKIALRRIEHRVREEGTIEFSSDPVRIEQTREKLAETIKKVKSLAEQGRVDQALDLLKSSILTSLRVSQLSAAEMLRDMVLEVDPRAIETLLEIEGHMNKPTINGQRYHDPLVWHDLERCIGSSALTRLFELSAQECYQPGETIIAQHEQGDSLFLVNSGTVSMHCGSGSKEVFLKKLHSGAILGAETVFEVSLATVSVRAETVVRLFAFSAESLDILEKDFPGSRKTIRNHCRDQINVLKLLKMSAADRRRDVRYKIEKKVETKISDMYGVVGPRTLMGCLHDISYGGVCYTIGIDSSRGLQRLLGRQMQVIFNLRDLGRVELLGEFVAFDRSVDNDNTYLVHVRTFEPIDPKVYEIIVQNSD